MSDQDIFRVCNEKQSVRPDTDTDFQSTSPVEIDPEEAPCLLPDDY